MNSRTHRGVRAAVVGMIVNVILAAVKLAAGLLGHSHALIADGVESFADIFSSLVVWRGLMISAQPADEDHPYGHGKAEPIAAAVVATTLLLAAVWIAVTAIRETISPHLTPAPFTLAVLLLVVLVKEGLFRYVLGEARSMESVAMRSDAWHHRSDAITSIAAAIGIGIALIGGPGYESADDIAAIVAAGIIAWNGWRLLRPAMDELMDASPNLALREEIRQIALDVSGVADVEKCLVRKMGYHYFVDMHLEVDPQMTVQRAHEVAHQVKDRIRAHLPAVYDVLVHIEPSRGR
jgi:cation diffusion facilitator family transporter